MNNKSIFPLHTVLVEPRPDDLFTHEFTGTVIDIKGDFATVRDKDGDCWTVDVEQIQPINEDE